MKKSILLVLTLPLILGSCSLFPKGENPSQKTTEETSQTGGQSGTQTGEQSGQGTEGSGTGSTTEGGTHSGGHHTGGGTTGGGTETGGGTGGQTGGGTGGQTDGGTTGGGTTGGGGSQTTTSTTVTKAIDDFGFANSKDVTNFDMATDLHVTCAKGGNTQNSPKYYSSDGAIRMYGKNTITFSSDKLITKICFTFSSEDKGNDLIPSTGTISKDRKTWTGSANSVTFTVDGSSGKACINTISVTYGGTGESTGGGTTGGGTGDQTGGGGGTGGQTGGDIQAGNGNTSHSFTSPWEGIQKDIVYQMFKGNLPHLTDFNQYALGDWEGSTIPYFNPYIESNWSKDAQKDYDLALKEMGYTLTSVEPYIDEEGNECDDTPVNCYSKGTFRVRTSHYSGKKNIWYFDVYAWNEYEEADPNFTVKSELDRSKITLKSGYQALNYSGGGYNYSANAVCKYSSYGMQFDADSEITITGDLHNINILFVENAYSCVVYAGTSTSNLSPVYNDACNFKLPSGTKVVKIKTLDKECIIENIAVN